MTLEVTQDDSVFLNSDQRFGIPAVRISGNNVRFVNLAGAEIRKSAESVNRPESTAVVVDGSGVVIENDGLIIARDGSHNAIIGSEFADVVIDRNYTKGYVRLGGGHDRFTKVLNDNNRSHALTTVDLGDGDDVATFEVGAFDHLNLDVIGGHGHDRLVISDIQARTAIDPNVFREVEVVELSGASGARVSFDYIHRDIGDIWLSPGLTLVLPDNIGSTTAFSGPATRHVHLSGGRLEMGMTEAFARISGSDAAETVILTGRLFRPTNIGTPNGIVTLAGGDDQFDWHSYNPSPLGVDGGAGFDILAMGQDHEMLSVAAFQGFELISHVLSNGFSGLTYTLTGVGSSVERLLLDPEAKPSTLQLGAIDAPTLQVGIGGSRTIILSDTTVGSLQDRHLIASGAGAATDQIVENRGIVLGNIAFGGGNDMLANSGTIVGASALGEGDDIYIHQGDGPLPEIDGGAGVDRLVLASTRQNLIADKVTGFEHLEIGPGPNFWTLDRFSGFSLVEFERGGNLNFINSINPNADLAMDGGFVIVGAGSLFRNVTGTAAAEIFELNHGSIGSVSLDAGDDMFAYNHFAAFPMGPSISGTIDGGSGLDTIALSVEGGRTIDLANMVGFERVNTGNFTASTSDVRLLNVNGFQAIETALQGKLTLAQSSSANATVRLASSTTLVLEASTTVGAVGVASAAVEAAQTGNPSLSIRATNSGAILGDVRLNVGNDVFDGRLGTVGGSIYGYAGDDTLRGGSGNDRIFGGFGADFIDLSSGGDDAAEGGAGDDGFVFGTHFTSLDRVDGGEGARDQLALQGTYAGLVLGPDSLVGIEEFGFLGGSVTRFGAPGNELYSYDVTFIDANVPLGQQLTVNFNSLRVGENATLRGAAELDGYFFTFGGQGIDVIIGGHGNDRFYFGADRRFGAGDRVDGRDGSDDQFGLQGDYSGVNAVVLAADALSGIEIIGFLSGANQRFGGGGADGYDYDITTHDANVAAGARMIIQANGLKSNGALDETLVFNGSAETDGWFRVFAGGGGDRIVTGAGADEIWGQGGDDLISGGGGGDTLRGGQGADRFIYLASTDSTLASRDSILDFDALDRIDLSAIDAIAGGADDPFTFIGAAAFAAAGQLRAFQDAGGKWIVEADVDGGGADLVISVSSADPGYALTATDFIL